MITLTKFFILKKKLHGQSCFIANHQEQLASFYVQKMENQGISEAQNNRKELLVSILETILTLAKLRD